MFSAYHRIAENRYRQRIGLDFEDFSPGQRFRHRPGVTLSQQDNADEALDTQNGAMLHFDAHYAGATAWQRPLMVSTLTLQRLIGMASKTYGRRSAILGFDDITMNGPLFGGDTLYAESDVLDVGPTGTIRTLIRGRKADGAEVARITCRMAIARRGADHEPVQEERFAAYHGADDGALVEQTGLWFEDCVAGESFVHAPSRTFHREEALMHAWRSLDLTPQVHVPETFVVAVATALTTRTFGRVVANLGWHDVQLPSPVAVGDTIEAESTILETRESRSRPGEGIISVATRARNQHGVEVLSYRRTLLVYRREATAPYARAGY
ncbi:MAG TPA: MaoC family dehydratase [Acetobacteraceae bacterium]|jgi:itaconyl-CoA hydratase